MSSKLQTIFRKDANVPDNRNKLINIFKRFYRYCYYNNRNKLNNIFIVVIISDFSKMS